MKYLTALIISLCFTVILEIIFYAMGSQELNIYRCLGILGVFFGFVLVVVLQWDGDDE